MTDPANPVDDNLPLTERDFDGIEHLDHPPPAWWKGLFTATIIFSVLYMQYYHLGTPGRSAVERYDQALAENMRLQFAEIGELQPDEATLVRMMNDRRWVPRGRIGVPHALRVLPWHRWRRDRRPQLDR